MTSYIKIGEFVKLSKSTIKTVLYYHKIGLLPEPRRAENGYRLYGLEELEQMRRINHLKRLGLNLSQIRAVMVNAGDNSGFEEALTALKVDLLKEKEYIEEQLYLIDEILAQKPLSKGNFSFTSEPFKKILDILNLSPLDSEIPDNEDLKQRQEVFGVLEDFQWDDQNQSHFDEIARYFKEKPEDYQKAADLSRRLYQLKDMSKEDPRIEELAREGANFIKSIPFLRERLYRQRGFSSINEKILNEMVGQILSPAQMEHKKLIQEYLSYQFPNGGDETNE
jgi:DNA-binding transcriptional MerR regulator